MARGPEFEDLTPEALLSDSLATHRACEIPGLFSFFSGGRIFILRRAKQSLVTTGSVLAAQGRHVSGRDGGSGLCKAYINGQIKILLFSLEKSNSPDLLSRSFFFLCVSPPHRCSRGWEPSTRSGSAERYGAARRSTHRRGISACAGLTSLVTLHVCETARGNLTL